MYPCVVACCALVLTLSRVADGVIAHNERTLDLRRDTALPLNARAQSTSVARTGHVPNDAHFIDYMSKMKRREDEKRLKRKGGGPTGDAVSVTKKIVLGVFSVVEPRRKRENKVRHSIRLSWMDHPAVCLLDNITDTCVIHVAFVVGDSGKVQRRMKRIPEQGGASWVQIPLNPPGTPEQPGVLELNITENMDNGKSFAWFEYASRRWDWADYVFKCDEDVFIHVDNLLEGIAEANAPGTCPEAYLGRVWTCLGNESCPPRSCGPPLGHDFWAYDAPNTSGCWTYMQGGMYGMSRQLASDITEPDGFFSLHRDGYEDMVTGQAVAQYAELHRKCLYIWDSQQVAKDHMYHHMRGPNEHPGGVSSAWDRYYRKMLTKPL